MKGCFPDQINLGNAKLNTVKQVSFLQESREDFNMITCVISL